MPTNHDSHRATARELAAAHLQRGDPLGWFDALYRQAAGQTDAIPWADLRPNRYLSEWLSHAALTPKRALVVGCGLGDDAELLASLGWSVIAFDISAEAIRWVRRRFPQSKVEYRALDMFALPSEWKHRFDLVVEIYTLQAIPAALRLRTIPLIADCVAPGGQLFLFARGRDESDPPGELPWPLTEAEVRKFSDAGLICESFDDFLDDDDPPVRRFRAIFQRAQTDTG